MLANVLKLHALPHLLPQCASVEGVDEAEGQVGEFHHGEGPSCAEEEG